MGWRIIKQPDERYARFSEIVDTFTHMDMTLSQAIELCQRERCTELEALEKCSRAIKEMNRWDEALEIIKTVRGEPAVKEILALLRKS